MLGLGRALGETIAVMIILSQPAAGAAFTPSIFAGGETFASKIANNAAEFDSPSKTGAYIAAGLVLFVVTFAVNALARIIADRGQREVMSVAHQPTQLSVPPAQRPADGQERPGHRLRRPGHGAGRSSRWSGCSYTVISKGARLVFTSTWWLQSQRGITPRREGGGAYHAIVGTVEIGADLRRRSPSRSGCSGPSS